MNQHDNVLADFEDTETAFAGKSTWQLRESFAVFKLFGIQSIIYIGTKIIVLGLKFKLPITWLVKYTIFKQFCGGTSIDDCEAAVDQMYKYKVGSILDYSVEACEREEDLDQVADEICRTIAKVVESEALKCSVFKMSGIITFDLLQRVSSQEQLTKKHQELWDRGVQRLDLICKYAADRKVPLQIDAEETWIQPAIDNLAEDMMVKYNTEKVIVYNTLQMYRHDRLAYLKDWYAKVNGSYKLGVKLVRGAYMEKERLRAEQLGYPSPIQSDKESTDQDFDAAMMFCLERLHQVAVFIGTHNEQSTLKAVDYMRANDIGASDPRVLFSQLYGMSEHISFNLAKHGYQVAKYVPYGPIKSVLPYLFRRAEENSSIKGHAGRELELLSREIVRRKRLV